MTGSSFRISSQHPRGMALRTIRTALIFRLDSPMIFSTRWISRMSYRLFTPPGQYSMRSSARSFQDGKNRLSLYGRLRRIISFRIIRSLQPTPSARITAISTGSSTPARIAAERQRSTAGSPDITVLYRTGTTGRFRSLRIGKSTTLNIP